jgi:hypothetical protein
MIIAGGVIDLSLRLVAMIDLIRRPRAGIRGPKALWVSLIATVNSVGLLPAAYLIWGRRRADSTDR